MGNAQGSAQGKHARGSEQKEGLQKLTRLVALWGALLGLAAVIEATLRAHPEALVLSADTVQRIVRDTMMFVGLGCFTMIVLGGYLGRQVQAVKNTAVAVTTGSLGMLAGTALAWALGAEVNDENGARANAYTKESRGYDTDKGQTAARLIEREEERR